MSVFFPRTTIMSHSYAIIYKMCHGPTLDKMLLKDGHQSMSVWCFAIVMIPIVRGMTIPPWLSCGLTLSRRHITARTPPKLDCVGRKDIGQCFIFINQRGWLLEVMFWWSLWCWHVNIFHRGLYSGGPASLLVGEKSRLSVDNYTL